MAADYGGVGLKIAIVANVLVLPYLTGISPARTQPIRDTTLPNNSIVDTSNGISTITGGTIAERNLFHSFERFSIGRRQTANFVSPSAAIQNILVRVTGGSRSEINGTLRTSGPSNPNLFLINPNGILFGQNARLDVRGSFIATTANAVGFGNRGFFSASAPNDPTLLTVNPSAFFFNQIRTQSSIESRAAGTVSDPLEGGLAVPNGQSLLLLGSHVRLDSGILTVPDGRVELGGLAEPGVVSLSGSRNNLHLGFPKGVARADVSLTNGARVDVSGSFAINARDIYIARSSVQTERDRDSGLSNIEGDIKLNATSRLEINDESSISASGNIQIKAASFFLLNGAELNVSSLDRSNAGDVVINARDQVSLNSSGRILSQAFGPSEAGNIRISAGQGNVSLAGASSISNSTAGSGDAGDINIRARDLSLSDGAQITAFTEGTGNSGNIRVRTSDAVRIVGVDSDRGFSSGLFTSSEGRSSGRGGNITVETDLISLADGAVVSAQTSGDASGGSITLQNLNALLMRRDSAISASAGTANRGGDGGNITIDAQFILASPLEDSDITANAFTGQGGEVIIDTEGLLGIRVQPQTTFASDITASSERGVQGNVTLRNPEVNPTQGLIELPTDLIDASRSIVQTCPTENSIPANNAQSQFVVTGRGGLPPGADEALGSDAVQVDLVTAEDGVASEQSVALPETNATDGVIVEAKGWVVAANGNVVLTPSAPTTTPAHSQATSLCPPQ